MLTDAAVDPGRFLQCGHKHLVASAARLTRRFRFRLEGSARGQGIFILPTTTAMCLQGRHLIGATAQLLSDLLNQNHF